MANPFAPDILPKILVRYVPQVTIQNAVDAILPPDIEGDARKDFVARLRPDALNDLPLLMEALVMELSKRQLLIPFVNTLLRLRSADMRLRGVFGRSIDVDNNGNLNEGQLQSLRNRREPFQNSKVYGDLIYFTRNQVCAIWVKGISGRPGGIVGTGFLIAPDLVLSARHVFDDALQGVAVPNADLAALPETKDEEIPGAVIKCIFDYWMPIVPGDVLTPPRSGITVVDVAQQWLVWSSQKHPKDGLSHFFDAPPDISQSLDCAVIRLARPIGAEAFRSGGGLMRGWVKLPSAKPVMAPASVAPGDAIAILQHPAGGPQGTDKGDFVEIDPSWTRLWYTTQAAGGSSGSPCFDSEATLVGFHNAGRPTAFRGPTEDCNQGVNIDFVVRALPAAVVIQSQKGITRESALWSLSDDRENPVPVLGRTEFKKAALALFDPRSDKRMIVVEEAKEVEAIGKSGKSFSKGILKAIARDRPGLVLEFSAHDLKPMAPEDFLNEAGRRIGIDVEQLGKPPPKPQDERQLARWWSNDLPDWFGGLVEERAISAGTVVHDAAAAGSAGVVTGRNLVINELIWFVIDDIHKAPPNAGMKELLAGLAGVTDTQPVLRAGLRALRWLVIGHVPDFVRERSIQYEPDTVSQEMIGEQEWFDCLFAHFVSAGELSRFNADVAKALYKFTVKKIGAASDPATKLSTIAGAIPDAIATFPS
jgi:Trypsin-like peptidase domain